MRKKSILHKILFIILAQQLTASSYTVSGYVKDILNGDPLIGANIYVENTSIGSATDKKGFYKIVGLKEGAYTFKVSYIGYKTNSESVNLQGENNDVILDFNLNYTSIEGNEVIVTAQAKGQMDAINKQLNSKSLVNIISSDRIQELPDANAAETVARVPGVSIRREGGEGNKVVIRGLSPKYNNITVNGVKLASTDNNDRSTDLSMISQYMLDGIEVTKAGTPDQDSDVLGGTVNFLLRKAEPGFHGNIITQGMHNGLKNTYNDNKFVVDLSNRFFNDRLGILMQVDFENRNRSSNEVGANYYLVGETLDSLNPLYLGGLNLNDWIRLNKRENQLQVFDIKIPNGNISYSNLNSKIDKDITRYSFTYALSDNYRYMNSSEGLNGINVLTESWKYEQTFLEKLKLEAYRSYSESINDDAYYDFAFSEQFAFDSSTYNRSIEKVQQIAKNDTSRTILNSYNYWTNKSSEKETATGLDFKYNFRFSDVISGNLKFGVKQRKKKRSFDRHNEYGIVNKAAGAKEQRDSLVSFFNLGSFILDGQDGNIPLTAFIDENYNGSDFYNGDYDFDAVADLDKMMEVYDYFSENWNKSNSNTNIDEYVMHHVHQTNSQMYDYRGDEEYSASYFMADFDISSQFNIVAGGRTETNKTTYYSMNSLDHALPHWIFVGDTTKHERENSYFFPALFLNYKPTKYLSIRYAKTNTLTRPDYTSLIPLTRATGNGNSLDWRNKFLEPGLSQNTDLSVSLIEDKLGLLTVGYFKKSIKDLIYSSGQRVMFAEDTARFDLSSDYINYTIGNYELNNPSKIDLSGFEIDYQTRFWYLPGALNGLVFNANYTVATSTVKYPRTVVSNYFDFDTFTFVQENNDTTYVDRLLDQPDKILNVSVGYDYKGFSGRLSMLFNDNVFVNTNFWPELRENTDSYSRFDLSVKQKLPAEGLEVFLNASNLTKTSDVSRYRGISAQNDNIKLQQNYGQTIDVGIRYAF
jgi:TonB-dependent receptor